MEDKILNDKLIVQYLLGDLPEPELARIEDRAFSDRRYLQAIEAVESDLIDTYVRGELSTRQREQFEQRFLASRERQQKLEFARALAQVTSELAVTEEEEAVRPFRMASRPASWWESFKVFVAGARPIAQFSMATVALVVIVGVSWLTFQTIRLRSEISRLRAEQQAEQTAQRERQQNLERQEALTREHSEDLAAQLQREQQQRTQSEELARQLQQERDRLLARSQEGGSASSPLVASLILLPGATRGGNNERQRLIVPRSVRFVRLQIGLERRDKYKSFRVELTSSAGRQAIWGRAGLQPRATRAGRSVILELPASALGTGEYELALKGINDRGASEDVSYHYFTVLKK